MYTKIDFQMNFPNSGAMFNYEPKMCTIALSDESSKYTFSCDDICHTHKGESFYILAAIKDLNANMNKISNILTNKIEKLSERIDKLEDDFLMRPEGELVKQIGSEWNIENKKKEIDCICIE